jgi:hypothetical protein
VWNIQITFNPDFLTEMKRFNGKLMLFGIIYLFAAFSCAISIVGKHFVLKFDGFSPHKRISPFKK